MVGVGKLGKESPKKKRPAFGDITNVSLHYMHKRLFIESIRAFMGYITSLLYRMKHAVVKPNNLDVHLSKIFLLLCSTKMCTKLAVYKCDFVYSRHALAVNRIMAKMKRYTGVELYLLY